MGLHASRQLSDKVLRYLKRVIVTPAVYRSFGRLNPDFRYRHWAGFSDHTHPFGLAVTCVFVKQSDLPRHCDQTWQELREADTTAGTAYPEVTPLVCRIPSRRLLANTPWASNPGAPVSDLGTDVESDSVRVFTGTRDRFEAYKGPRLCLGALLTVTVLGALMQVTWATVPSKRTYPRADAHAQFSLRSRNINRVPFRLRRLRADLGPTNPRLTNIARGTLAPTAVRDSHPT